MKIEFDKDSDALYLALDESTPIVGSAEMAPGIIVDYDADHGILGLEILNMSRKVSAADLEHAIVLSQRAARFHLHRKGSWCNLSSVPPLAARNPEEVEVKGVPSPDRRVPLRRVRIIGGATPDGLGFS